MRQSLFALLFLLMSKSFADIPDIKTFDVMESKVLFVESHTLPIVDVSVVFPAGSGFAKTPGLSYLTLQMIGLATDKMGEEETAKRFDALGAVFQKTVDRDKAVFSLRTLKNYGDPAIAHFTTIMTRPAFEEKALAREKGRMIAEIQQNSTLPGKIAEKAFFAQLYPNHPYGAPLLGEENTVKNLTTDTTKAFYQQNYCRQGAIVSFVGDISEEEVKRYAQAIVSNLPNCKPPALLPLAQHKKGQTIIPFDSAQSHILFGLPAFTHHDPDYYAILVGNYILGGGGFSSRMMHEVREKRGLAYHASTRFIPLLEKGPFLGSLQTKKESTKEALEVARSVLVEFLKKGPSTEELDAAKSNFKGGFYGQIDSNQKLLYYLNTIGFYHLPLDFLKNFTQKVDAVTSEDIRKAFAARMKMDDLAEIIVGGLG